MPWRWLLFLFVVPALALLNSCGSSSSSSSTPSITASCASTQNTGTEVVVGTTANCTATISNLSSTLVNWSVNGGATNGTIATSGASTAVYTAPSTVPGTNNNVITITAAAAAQSSLTTTTTLTIEPDTTINSIVCLDASQNTATTVASGDTLNCTATSASNTAISKVNWFVDTVQNGNDAVGKITTQGSYTSPLVPPAGNTVTVTATSQAISSNTKSVTITDVFGPKVLSGPYVFSTNGRVVSGNTFFARAGSFIAGGNQIIGGIEDTNPVGAAAPPPSNPHSFTGLYDVGPDGRGTMQFCEGNSSGCTPGAATAFFSIAVVSPQRVEIMEFSQPSTSIALKVASGEMVAQTASASLFNDSGLSGTYSFNFSGYTSAASPESEVGEFTADGLPDGVLFADSATTPYRIDVNSSGPQSFTASSYSIDSSGRGTATIGSSTFHFYLVSASQAKFIETDASAILVGDAFKQQASPCTWGAGALNGTLVFGTGGTNSGAGVADLVSFTADGSGGVTGGSIDENVGGVLRSTSSLGGTYSIDSCGRGTLSIPATAPNHTYVFYMTSVNSALIQEVTSGVVAHGALVQPQSSAFTAASLNGSFTLRLAGSNGTGPAGNEEDFTGQLTITGTASSQSGTVSCSSVLSPPGCVDVNNTAANTGVTQSGLMESGSDTVSATAGRVALSLTSPQNLVLYIVSPTQALAMIGNDGSGLVAIGSVYLQF